MQNSIQYIFSEKFAFHLTSFMLQSLFFFRMASPVFGIFFADRLYYLCMCLFFPLHKWCHTVLCWTFWQHIFETLLQKHRSPLFVITSWCSILWMYSVYLTRTTPLLIPRFLAFWCYKWCCGEYLCIYPYECFFGVHHRSEIPESKDM